MEIALNKVQQAAFELIQSDARFIYTLTNIQRTAKNINSNYVMMCQPYIGIFADGAEQWCRKVGLPAPQFNDSEKEYYSALRLSHKLYEMHYNEYMTALMKKMDESDSHFYAIRSYLEKIIGYYNVGTDLYNGEFCGNTILCALYTPVDTFNNKGIDPWIRDISIVSGKLAAFFNCTDFPPYAYNDSLRVSYKDYHFFNNCPLKSKTDFGFLLFSILCSINFVIVFIEDYFVDEIPQKFKFAYLQYYYMCDFIEELNHINCTNYRLDNSLKNRTFRNCLAHYGLGQFLSESDIIQDDILKGLTVKAFNMDYVHTKAKLYQSLSDLAEQIKQAVILSQ